MIWVCSAPLPLAGKLLQRIWHDSLSITLNPERKKKVIARMLSAGISSEKRASEVRAGAVAPVCDRSRHHDPGTGGNHFSVD